MIGDDPFRALSEAKRRGGRSDADLIKERERLNVMGVLMHQIDQNNYIVTVAVVDKYGELVAYRDFMKLHFARLRDFKK